jgi:hypothetical protein
MADIMCNRIRTPDGTIIESKHRHDYVYHLDANGFTYSVDGGKDYLRRLWTEGAPLAQEMSVYSDEPHSLIREVTKWGTRGVNGDEPLRYVPLMEMSDDHIKACLDTQYQMIRSYREAMIKELRLRGVEYEE